MQVFQSRVIAIVCTLSVAAGAARISAEQTLSKQDATRFAAKLAQIEKNAQAPRKSGAARSTQVTDAELNAYFRYLAGPQIPVGIAEPEIRGVGNGRLTGRAIVDLDAVRTQKKRGWMDPLGYLMGRLPISASGTLTARNGIGRFQLESAEISGVTIPKSLLQELLSYYSRTPENPGGINMDEPFALPAGIQEIRVGQGTAVIVQ
jgi:hypothetical protein